MHTRCVCKQMLKYVRTYISCIISINCCCSLMLLTLSPNFECETAHVFGCARSTHQTARVFQLYSVELKRHGECLRFGCVDGTFNSQMRNKTQYFPCANVPIHIEIVSCLAISHSRVSYSGEIYARTHMLSERPNLSWVVLVVCRRVCSSKHSILYILHSRVICPTVWHYDVYVPHAFEIGLLSTIIAHIYYTIVVVLYRDGN